MPPETRYIGYLRQDIARPIIVNSQDVLQFYVEFASPRPAGVDRYITCYASALEPFGFQDDPTEIDFRRTERLYHWLMDRILTFRVENRKGYYTAVDVRTYDLNAKAEFAQYEPVPVLLPEMADNLNEALQHGHPLRGLVLPERTANLPLVVVIDGYFRGPFEKVLVSGASVGLRLDPDEMGWAEAIDDGFEVISDGEIWFVERNRFHDLLEELRASRGTQPPVTAPEEAAGAAGTPAAAPRNSAPGAAWTGGPGFAAAGAQAAAWEVTPASALSSDALAAAEAPGASWAAGPANVVAGMSAGIWPGSPASPWATAPAAPQGVSPARWSRAPRERGDLAPQLTEAQFLARLQAQARGQGLFFRQEDLIAFHTALKTGSLVVLSGLSGTGKSRLVDVYRQALGLSERSHFLWLSVRPNWNDDADLIGYYDPLNRLYRPGETGLVDLLIAAQRNPDELFMVCLDEMNLARVEHYFSQFLSCMERPVGQRQLRLYAPELQAEVYNSHRYPPFVNIGPNVLFCGTINVDESTHSFSDKVLDRSNVIRMDHVDLVQWWQELCQVEGEASAGAPIEAEPAPIQPMVSAAEWLSWRPPFNPAPYGREVEFLHGLNQRLASAGVDAQFGYRVVRQILLYLHFLPRGAKGQMPMDRRTALDQQVCQRILIKVRGTGAELRDLFKPGGILETYLMESDLSDFSRSLAEVRRKYMELEQHDFTS